MTAVTTFKEAISRSTAMAYGQEALRIGETGRYWLPTGRVVDLRAGIDKAVRNTRAYAPTEP